MSRKIGIIILAAVSIGSLFLAYSQKAKADHYEQLARQEDENIKAMTAEVEKLKKIAEANLNEAMFQAKLARQAEQNCKKTK